MTYVRVARSHKTCVHSNELQRMNEKGEGSSEEEKDEEEKEEEEEEEEEEEGRTNLISLQQASAT